MTQIAEEKLSYIAEQLKNGVVPTTETVRTLLLWFNAERRGIKVIEQIKNALNNYGLTTEPNFEEPWMDGEIKFLATSGSNSNLEGTSLVDPTICIGRLDAANKEPTFIKPDSTLQQAVTIMLCNDFSQLPVMSSPRDVKGIISWKTIGSRLALNQKCDLASQAMEPAHIVSIDESLFDAIIKVQRHDYVLVKANDNRISGIVTASDFNDQFQSLAEPFLLVGEIENGVRRMLHQKFTIDDLSNAKSNTADKRTIESPSDLTFGEYIRLIESPDKWEKLGLAIDRKIFVERLHRVREIRNDVMHFDPDGLSKNDIILLREFAQFLKRLRDVGAV